jgi:hypothetical protein
MPVGVLHSLRGFFARESIQGLDGAEREDLTQAQLRATRPIVSGVLLCGAVLLAIITVFEMAGATPSIGYPGWLQMLVASLVAGCAAAVARLPQWQHRLVLTLVATLLLGIFMSMPLPGATGQLALRTGLFQLLPLALMALMVRPVSLLAFALLIVAMAQLRIVLYGAPGTGSALYWLYTLTTIGFGLVLAGYRSDFAASAWRMRRRLVRQASTDPVTGLLNRNGWSERAEAAHARASTTGWDTTGATRCCSAWAPSCRRAREPAGAPHASVARNSPCCWKGTTRARRGHSPNACAASSVASMRARSPRCPPASPSIGRERRCAS